MSESSSLRRILLVAGLTFREAARRKIALAAAGMSVAFLGLYALALHFAASDMQRMAEGRGSMDSLGMHMMQQQLLWIGLFPAGFLVALTAVFIAAGTISSEIDTGVAYAMVSLPLRRAEIVLGKCLGLAVMLCTYSLVFNGAVLLLAQKMIHSRLLEGWPMGLALLVGESLPLLALAVLGSTRLPTMANGVLCVAAYGIGFIGGLIETIGAALKNEALVNTGIVSSLLMPIDVVHRKATSLLMPKGLLFQDNGFGLSGPGEPSVWMMLYAAVFVIALVALAARSFTLRDL
jgi:ABC-type transport system involved in multi-copper enzyme maturation permease subunit